jgi:hypothetical protein
MRVIVLNSNNLVQDGQNNKLIYKFPNSVLFKDNHIAVSSVSMYYSWFNITQALQNNTFSYQWITRNQTLGTDVIQTFTVVIPDGLYEITELNSYLQFIMVQNGTYLIDGTNYVYYASMSINPTRYAVQINTLQFPSQTELPAGYTIPPNYPGVFTNPAIPVLASESFNPSIIIPQFFNNIVGYSVNFQTSLNINNTFDPATAPSNVTYDNATGTLSYLSTKAPNVQPNSSIYFSLSNINNPYSAPSSIIYSLVPSGIVGTLITERPPQFMWNKMIDGTYNQLALSFLGNDLQPIVIQDPSMTILLTIKDGNEMGLK